MNKSEIIKILGKQDNIIENDKGTALDISLITDEIDVFISIPYDTHELFYDAKSKSGVSLVSDSHECYGEMELEDYKECLQDIVDIMKSPKFRLANEGKTIEAYGYKWYYFFGEFSS